MVVEQEAVEPSREPPADGQLAHSGPSVQVHDHGLEYPDRLQNQRLTIDDALHDVLAEDGVEARGTERKRGGVAPNEPETSRCDLRSEPPVDLGEGDAA